MLIRAYDFPVSFTMVSGSPTERVEPVDLTLTKKHLRFTASSEDDLIAGYIQASRAYFEEQTERQAVDAIWEYALDAVPTQRFIVLPRPPLASVESVTYLDADGEVQTFDAENYRVLPSGLEGSPVVFDPYCRPGRIELVSGASWPTTNGASRCLRIRRTCGYGDSAAAMPGIVKAILYLLVGHLHRNRAEVMESKRSGDALQQLPMGAQVMLTAFKWSAVVDRNEQPDDGLCR